MADTSDCAPSDITRWQIRYRDEDLDTFGAANGATCVGTHAGYISQAGDCYDKNNQARPFLPGGTYFTTTRGTSAQGNDSAGNTWNSFDYDCNGNQETQTASDFVRYPIAGIQLDCTTACRAAITVGNPASCGGTWEHCLTSSAPDTCYFTGSCGVGPSAVCDTWEIRTQACR